MGPQELMGPDIFCLLLDTSYTEKENSMVLVASRVNAHTHVMAWVWQNGEPSLINKTVNCYWTDHLTRRARGRTLRCRRRKKMERSALHLSILKLVGPYELYNRFRVLRVVALQVAASRLSSVVTVACSLEEQADRLLVVKKREEIHVSVVM